MAKIIFMGFFTADMAQNSEAGYGLGFSQLPGQKLLWAVSLFHQLSLWLKQGTQFHGETTESSKSA